MAAQKFIALVAGKLKELFATQVSAGVANANQIPALNGSGVLDISLMPVGVGADVVTCPSFENLAAGQFVNLFSNGGVLNARLANATTNGKPAHGFVIAAATAPAVVTVYLIGALNNALTGLVIGTDYYLDIVAGGISATPPSASGNIVQYIGTAESATAIAFANQTYIQVG